MQILFEKLGDWGLAAANKKYEGPIDRSRNER